MAGTGDFQSWMRKQGAPVTLGLIGSFILGALLFWFTRSEAAPQFMLSGDSHVRPWSFLTYAWVSMPFTDGLNVIFFVFLMYWLFFIGSSLERVYGSGRLAMLMGVCILFEAVVVWLGTFVANAPGFAIAGAYLPVAVLTMVWCAKNLTEVIMMYGIIPMSGKWLAVLDVVLILLIYGNQNPLMGVFCSLPLVGMFFVSLGRVPAVSIGGRADRGEEKQATRAQARYDDKYYDDVKRREKDREEREKLRKLFEGSLKDEE